MEFSNNKNNLLINNNSTTQELENRLLPVGFYDLLFDEARNSHEKINQILNGFFSRGFNLIKPALLEFEDNYLKNKKDSFLFNHYFRSIDNISGRSLVIRNDITMQINRIFANKLNNSQLPIKLCYVGDVFCNFNNQLYADRQQTQIGCEIIYQNQDSPIFDVIDTTLQALQDIGLKNLSINFSLPNFLNLILEQIQLEPKIKNELFLAISNRNLTAIKNINCQHNKLLIEITFCNYDFFNLTNKIKAVFDDQKINNQINHALKIYQFVKTNFPNISPCFVLFSDDSNDYHQNVTFEIFSNQFRYSIARGGGYNLSTDSSSDNQPINAIGSTIYVNHLRKISIGN
jgi:ATP phosphoribosyltransferase regulatory subunit